MLTRISQKSSNCQKRPWSLTESDKSPRSLTQKICGPVKHACQQAPQLGAGPPTVSHWSLNAALWWDFLQCFLRELYSHQGCPGHRQWALGRQELGSKPQPMQLVVINAPCLDLAQNIQLRTFCTSHSAYVPKDQWLFNNVSTNNFFWLLSLTAGSQWFWGTAASAKSLKKSPHLWYLSATQPSHSYFPSMVFHGLEHVDRWPVSNSCASGKMKCHYFRLIVVWPDRHIWCIYNLWKRNLGNCL